MSVGLGRGACFGCGASRWCGREHRRKAAHDSSLSGRMSRAGRPRAGPTMPACAGAVDVAHSRLLCVGGNLGIVRNSNFGGGHGSAPMCADPPHRTWEPDHRTHWSPEKPVIPTRISPRPAKSLVSHAQHRRQPHPPVAPHHLDAAPDAVTPHAPHRDRSTSGSRSVRFSPANPTSRRARQTREVKTTCHTSQPSATSKSSAAQPISRRSATDLEAECDRSRCELRPISRRNRTDLDTASTPLQTRRINTTPHPPTPHSPRRDLDELNQLIMLARRPIKVSTHPWRRSSAR